MEKSRLNREFLAVLVSISADLTRTDANYLKIQRL